jgi:hypothetical protein
VTERRAGEMRPRCRSGAGRSGVSDAGVRASGAGSDGSPTTTTGGKRMKFFV